MSFMFGVYAKHGVSAAAFVFHSACYSVYITETCLYSFNLLS